MPTAKNLAHATALTEMDINLLKRPKTSKYLFGSFQNFPKLKNGKSGGAYLFNINVDIDGR